MKKNDNCNNLSVNCATSTALIDFSYTYPPIYTPHRKNQACNIGNVMQLFPRQRGKMKYIVYISPAAMICAR